MFDATTFAIRNFGPKLGLALFWTTQLLCPTVLDVRARLEHLAEEFPDYIPKFVAMAVKTNRDATTLLYLSQSYLSDQYLRPLLKQNNGIPPEGLHARMRWSQTFSSAYVGTQMILEGPETAKAADQFCRRLYGSSRSKYDCYFDSISFHPYSKGTQRRFETGFSRPKVHRLLIVENLNCSLDLKHLLRDAETATVIAPHDLYGKSGFDCESIRGVKQISVENVRTNITRFSLEYHTLHADTKNAASHIVNHLHDIQPSTMSIFGSALSHVTLDLADKIFFETLKVRALSKLLDDQKFDHIVIAHQGPPNSQFDKLLSCIPSLRTDPRVEFVSTATTLAQRLTSRDKIDTATTQPTSTESETKPRDLVRIENDLQRDIYSRAKKIKFLSCDEKVNIALFARYSSDYSRSIPSAIETLSETYKLDCIFSGGSLGAMLKDFPKSHKTIRRVNPITISNALGPNVEDLSDWIQFHMLPDLLKIGHSDIKLVLTAFAKQILDESLISCLVDYMLVSAWLSIRSKERCIPKLSIFVPIRDAKVCVMSAAMRDYGIPSLALEPHGLNGNYCRYSKISTDFYGVISGHFRDTAQSDFGISKERCKVIGSSRIVAPRMYNPERAQIKAKATLKLSLGIDFNSEKGYVSFFSQPSQWNHMAKVWTNILIATQDLDVTLLLKTHPEESISRVQRYVRLAKKFGADDRVIHVQCDPSTLIKASDIVLTGYSAAALDAAVLQKPVLCVSADNEAYPVDQHKIVHTTLCGTADVLRAELKTLLTDPKARTKQTDAFWEAEPQFISGPDDLLRSFVTEILETPTSQALRKPNELPKSLFLDGPFTPFNV